MNNLIDINPSLIDYAHRYLQRFMTITIDELKMLLSYCEVRQVDKRTILVEEGDVDNYLFSYQWGLLNPGFFTLPRRIYLGASLNF